MKRYLTFLITVFIFSASSQTFTDLASSQGITFIQNSPYTWGNGMSFFDFNEDGWDDLTFPSNTDSIFIYENVFGSYVQIFPSIYAPGDVRQICWVDYDNNGDLDLFVTFDGAGMRLYRNDGNFQFSDHTAIAGFDDSPFRGSGFAFSDPDGDNDLDVYICAYESVGYTPNPVANRYYENQGNGTFIEKSVMYGIDNGLKTSFMPAWYDFNNDNVLDLHVINDRVEFMDELYLHSGNNNYSPVASSVGVENLGQFPMSLSVSDFNNDGFQDVFVTDVANGSAWMGVNRDYKLFQNNNGASFNNVASAMNIPVNSYAWGALWVDYNNDCFEDLYVATGFNDTVNNQPHTSLLYKNNQGLSFNLVTDSIFANITKTSWCPVKGDINHDGFYDIVVLNDNSAPNILLNSGNSNNYIRVSLVGTTSNRLGIGSLIKVYANNTCQTQTVFCGSGLHAQNSQHKIFGIGSDTEVDSVIVTFPNGNIARRFNLPANNTYEIIEQTVVEVPLVTGNPSNNFCMGDTITIGIPGYTNYLWNTGDTTETITISSSGYYSFTAKNAVGDTLISSLPLWINFQGPIQNQMIVLDAPCGNNSFGSAQIIPGQPNLVDSILWSDGFVGTMNDSLAPGNYDYTLVSIYGCVQTGNITINAIQPFTTQYITTPATDNNGGSIDVYTWGGTAPFEYIIDTTVFGSFVNNLNPGTYQMTIIDALGCSQTIQFTILDETTASLGDQSPLDYNIYVTNETLFVCGRSEISKNDVNVYDVSGKKILDNSWIQDDVNCLHRPCERMKGLYLVEINQNDRKVSKTIFIR